MKGSARALAGWAAVAAGALAPGLASAQAAASATPPSAVAAAFSGARFSRVEGGQGVPINVVQKGDPARPAIVFLHGYRQSHLSWFAQFGSRLSERCHLVAFDLRGHGDSGAPWAAGAYDSGRPWADDLAAVLRATGARRPLLVGWSFGGNLAVDYLREYGAKDVAGLVLVGSTGRLLAARPAPAAGAASAPSVLPSAPPPAPPLAQRVELADRIAAFARSTELVYGPRVDAAAKAVLNAAAMRASPDVDAPTAARARRGEANDDLIPRLPQPLLLVNGADDPIVPRENLVRLKAALPAARIEDFAASGHAPFIDEAARFNALLDGLHCPVN